MYHFSYFKENDKEAILSFLKEYPFAFLTGCDPNGKPVATQVPMLFEERDNELYLQAHIMRNTDHHKAFMQNPNALLVFTGPSCYVSASWYTNPQSGSTWNYMSVHITGEIQFMEDEALRAFMQKLTLQYEKNNLASPTVFNNIPESYKQKMLPAIVGFEIKAAKIDTVFKLSQNKDELDYSNIITKLEAEGGQAVLIAAEMKKRHTKLFASK
jgi:transcriptional regulator